MQTCAKKANKADKCTHNIHRRTTLDKEYEKHWGIDTLKEILANQTHLGIRS